MSEIISLNDLPSVKYEKELKDSINYNTLENSVKNVIEDEEIHSWVQNFKSKVEEYLTNSPRHFSFNNDKRCKDFNYLIIEIINKIHSLSDNIGRKAKWSNEIKKWRDDYFSRNPSLISDKNNKYWDLQLKDLYDLCEDYLFVQEKLEEIKISDKCESFITKMNEKKEVLNQKRTFFERKIRFMNIPNIPCSHTILDNHIPPINCTPITKPDLAPDADVANDDQLGSGESGDRLRIHLSSSFGGFNDDRQRSSTLREGNETNSDSSSNAISLVSLPIFGVLVCSFLLYRFTPLRSKFHGNFLKNVDAPLNKDDKTIDQMLFNTSNLSDNYSENMQYNVSYQTIQN
ncbi:PIR Superfamily Protein [Plasmodium ovale wallikeri]|uniref:PIR Superfamily Protein n=1 Tax=Plasmodium ovale wallikeri TaxID=864142 RepID=A0A1A9AL54_PLAOA|nr:PIR Superfamily Protein [Plasmodium ovale wallikeri]